MDYFVLSSAALGLLVLFFFGKYTYWQRRGISTPIPVPLLGNYWRYFLIKETAAETVKRIYTRYQDKPFAAAYYGTEPVLIPRDPEIIKTIVAKDFSKFNGRLHVEHEFRDPTVTANLFSASGDNWKVLRQNLNPLFTSGKLKSFFGLILECADTLDNYLETVSTLSEIQDFKDISSRFTLEAIGSTLFGLRFEAMVVRDSYVKKLAEKFEQSTNKEFFQGCIRDVWPTIFHLFKKKIPIDEGLIVAFGSMATESFKSRGNKPIGRNDLIDSLLTMRMQGYIEGDGIKDDLGERKRVKIEMTDDVLVAQVLVFLGAGFSTSSTTMSFALYELAKQPVLQERLREEIKQVLSKTNGEITYESIKEMKYMEMVLTETLRMYPVLPYITRECTSDYEFPEYGLRVEKGMRIHLPVLAIHHDPKYYPNPSKFDPERFSPDRQHERTPYTFLAFGEGQRMCIGMRFSKIQVGIGMIKILSKYKVELSDQTVKRPECDPRIFIGTAVKNKILLKMTRLKDN